MDELINQTGQILQQYPELINNQVAGIVTKEMINWINKKQEKNQH